MKYIVILVSTMFMCLSGFAQKFPERTYIRSGNSSYDKGNFPKSEIEYRHALEKTPNSYEAAYNLGNALYKQERYAEAAQTYSQIAGDSTHIGEAASTSYNAGNALFKQRQLEQALESYKNSLRLNPNDQQAKFNLAYTKKLLENQDKDNKDDKQDKNKDQNKDKNKDQQDNKDQKQPEKPQQQEQKQSSMSQEEAERMLEAMQMNEDKTREKVNEQKVKTVGKSGKNW